MDAQTLLTEDQGNFIQVLKDYWLLQNTTAADLSSPAAFQAAQTAMSNLLLAATDYAPARDSFADPNNAIFLTALIAEPNGWSDSIAASLGEKPIRQQMLEGILAASNGGFWSPPDPTGIASWISSEISDGSAMVAALKDSNPNVRLAAINLLNGVAIPVLWSSLLLPVLPVVPEAASKLKLRLTQVGTAGGPTVKTGNGQPSVVSAPPAKDWYVNGWTWVALATGLLAGGVGAEQLAKRSR